MNTKIEGMHCGGCMSRIEQALRLAGAQDVDITIERQFAHIVFDDAKIEASALIDAIKSLGYKATNLSTSPHE